jgi:hypothetical protein
VLAPIVRDPVLMFEMASARRVAPTATALMALGLAAMPAALLTDTSTGTTIPNEEPPLELRPLTAHFGSVIETHDEDRTVRILNHSDHTVVLGQVEVDGEGYRILFDNCSGKAVERNNNCAVTIRFTPPTVGAFDGHVVLRSPVELSGVLTGSGLSEVETTTTLPLGTAPPTTVLVDTEPPTTVPLHTAPPTTVPLHTVPPSSTPPTTSPDQNAPLTEQLKRCEADAKNARIKFAPALEMVVGQITHVQVSAMIGPSGPASTESGPPTTEVPAVLHCQVSATLSGLGFDIDPAEPQPGSFLDSPELAWSWQVKPTRVGQLRLDFQLLPLARDGEVQLPGTPVLFAATIAVDAAPQSFWHRVNKAVSGVVTYPLVTSFGALVGIVTVSAAAWKWVLKRPWPWASSTGKKKRPHRRSTPRRRPSG